MSRSNSVSVVIPVHNGETFVAEAIASVFAQKTSAAVVTQVIVVDNNSADGTLELVRGLVADRYGDRLIVASEPRPGPANARNMGFHFASGTWLAFLDADDLWLSTKLEKQMAAVEQNPKADLFFTLGREFHSAELSEEEKSTRPCRPESYPMLTPSSLLLRREVFAQVGNLPDVPSGEFIAWYGWARELGFKDFVVPEVLVQRRIHVHNTTRGAGAMAGYPMAAKWLMDKRRQNRMPRAETAS